MYGSVQQCAAVCAAVRRCAAIRQCGSVYGSAEVCGRARGSVWYEWLAKSIAKTGLLRIFWHYLPYYPLPVAGYFV